MKTITLPDWVEQHADEHARNHAEFECGISDIDSPEYKKAYHNAFKKFCLEYYEHSLIPAETEDSILAENPYAIPASAAYRNFIPSGKELPEGQYTDKNFYRMLIESSNIPASQKASAIKRFRRAARTLEDLFLDIQFGPESDKNRFRIYDHQKKVNYNESERYGQPSRRALANLSYREVLMNRYTRLFVASTILAVIKSAYNADGAEILNTVRQTLADVNDGDLNKKKMTDAFSDTVFRSIEKAIDSSQVRATDIAIRALKDAQFHSTKSKKEPEELKRGREEYQEARSEIQKQLEAPQLQIEQKPAESQDQALARLVEPVVPETVEKLKPVAVPSFPAGVRKTKKAIKEMALKAAESQVAAMSDEEVLAIAKKKTKYAKTSGKVARAKIVKAARKLALNAVLAAMIKKLSA
jgi:hypothetical protein